MSPCLSESARGCARPRHWNRVRRSTGCDQKPGARDPPAPTPGRTATCHDPGPWCDPKATTKCKVHRPRPEINQGFTERSPGLGPRGVVIERSSGKARSERGGSGQRMGACKLTTWHHGPTGEPLPWTRVAVKLQQTSRPSRAIRGQFPCGFAKAPRLRDLILGAELRCLTDDQGRGRSSSSPQSSSPSTEFRDKHADGPKSADGALLLEGSRRGDPPKKTGAPPSGGTPVSERLKAQAGSGTSRRRMAAPTRPKPAIIIAQVAGSGIGVPVIVLK